MKAESFRVGHFTGALAATARNFAQILEGPEAAIDTLLVLSGVTSRAEMDDFPYRPAFVLNGVGEIVETPPAF